MIFRCGRGGKAPTVGSGDLQGGRLISQNSLGASQLTRQNQGKYKSQKQAINEMVKKSVKSASGCATERKPLQIPRQTNHSFGKPDDCNNGKGQLCPASADALLIKRRGSHNGTSNYEDAINDNARIHNAYEEVKSERGVSVKNYMAFSAKQDELARAKFPRNRVAESPNLVALDHGGFIRRQTSTRVKLIVGRTP